jgi:transposase-like protein
MNVHVLITVGVNADGHRKIPADQRGLHVASARTARAGLRGWSDAVWPGPSW